MKKIYLLLTAVLMTATLMAENVKVQLTTGKTMEGVLISYTEDVLVIEPNTIVKYEKRFTPNDVTYFDIEGVGRCNSIDGKFIFDESTRIIPIEEASVDVAQEKKVEPSNPNEIIGKAFKTCGGVALGIGVPALTAGTILTIVGHVMPISGLLDSKLEAKTRCSEAGCYLMPIGASLTIIGIPLIVQGKRIAEFNFNYTGNGAGIAMNF